MNNLNDFMNSGINHITDTAARFYMGNRRGHAFMLTMASALRKSAKARDAHEKQGTHIPPFLIASIASSCNLYCAGCYARANGGCSGDEQTADLTAREWRRVFSQASDAGVSFIFLAGGEPLMRRDVILAAAEFDNIFFPIFTNGTLINDDYIDLFDQNRHLIPVLSIEGDEDQTDRRRGNGVSETIRQTVARLKEKGILFGTSITVTSENKDDVTEGDFVGSLRDSGCGLIFYVEYVPAEENTEHLILDDAALADLQARIDALRDDRQNKGVIMLSFPGDEEEMGGCLAAGRGFFHINSTGGAEPCPFSPYSELSVKDHSLLEILESPFFERVREISAAEALSHKGGCTLFQVKDEVEVALTV